MTLKEIAIGDSSYNKLAIWGAILSLFGGFLLFLPLIGFVLGIIAINQIRKTKEKGRLLAFGAIFIGGIDIFAFLSGFFYALNAY